MEEIEKRDKLVETNNEDEGEKEMSFLDHLEELRWTIFRALGGILIVTIVCSFFSKWIIDELLLGP